MITLQDIKDITEWCKERKNINITPYIIPESLYNNLVNNGMIDKSSVFIIPSKTIPDGLIINIRRFKINDK